MQDRLPAKEQRLALTPAAAECNAATVGTTAAVPYEADYVFWKKAE